MSDVLVLALVSHSSDLSTRALSATNTNRSSTIVAGVIRGSCRLVSGRPSDVVTGNSLTSAALGVGWVGGWPLCDRAAEVVADSAPAPVLAQVKKEQTPKKRKNISVTAKAAQ